MDYLDRLQVSAKRNRAIYRLRLNGWTVQQLAKKYGLTRQRVDQIIKREKK